MSFEDRLPIIVRGNLDDFDEWTLILLALVVYTESGSGTFPVSVMQSLVRVFLNRVNSGLYPDIVSAIIGSNSALQSSSLVQLYFPELLGLGNMTILQIKELMANIKSMMGESVGWAVGWERALLATYSAMYALETNEVDPTNGATNFVQANNNTEWGGIMESAQWRSNPSNVWSPYYAYSTSGPFWSQYPPGIGSWIWVLYDNRDYCFYMTGIP